MSKDEGRHHNFAKLSEIKGHEVFRVDPTGDRPWPASERPMSGNEGYNKIVVVRVLAGGVPTRKQA